MTKIYHNPRCRKSRETLALLEEKGENPEIILYLVTPPCQKELAQIIDQLGISAEQLLRKNESLFKEQFKGEKRSEKEWIEVMVANPKLIERPIVVKNNKAAIGRPPEHVLAIL